jgi:hypothetical protein
MPTKENGAPAVTTQGGPDRIKLDAEIPIERRLETQAENRDLAAVAAAVTEDLCRDLARKRRVQRRGLARHEKIRRPLDGSARLCVGNIPAFFG